MKMAYAPLNLCLELPEDSVTSLILEQPKFYYDFITDIYGQISGSSGTVYFSDTDSSFSMTKSAVLLSQFIPFETNQKPMLNALYAKMKKVAQDEEFFLSAHELSSQIETFIHSLAGRFDEEIIWDHPDDITLLLKAVSVRFFDKQPDLQSQVLDYMLACRGYLGKRLFITVNLRSYLGEQEAEALYRSVVLHKITMLCIENREYKHISHEKRLIIDEDLCVI